MPAQAFDPVFTEVDRAVLAELGVQVCNAERLRCSRVMAAEPGMVWPYLIASC